MTDHRPAAHGAGTGARSDRPDEAPGAPLGLASLASAHGYRGHPVHVTYQQQDQDAVRLGPLGWPLAVFMTVALLAAAVVAAGYVDAMLGWSQ